MTHGLGRRPAPDPRDRAFRIADVAVPTDRTLRYWYAGGAWFDQGDTGTCVGHGWGHLVEDGPITHTGTIDPMALYDRATELDEWPGNEGDRSSGTSVRAGALALREMGLISTFLWAAAMTEVDNALLELGPLTVGTIWTEGMFYPDASGFVTPGGSVVGGHCFLLDGVNLETGTYRAKNSWGRGYGDRGFFRLYRPDLEYLLFGADGEACLATELR